MKFLTAFLVISIAAIVADASSYVPKHAEKIPGKPNECYFKQYDMQMTQNKEYQNPKFCGVMQADEHCFVYFGGCTPPRPADPPCFHEEDKTKPYPKCCMKAVCPEKH